MEKAFKLWTHCVWLVIAVAVNSMSCRIVNNICWLQQLYSLKEAKFECDKLAKFKVQNMKLLLTKPFLTTLYLLSFALNIKISVFKPFNCTLKLITITVRDLKG